MQLTSLCTNPSERVDRSDEDGKYGKEVGGDLAEG